LAKKLKLTLAMKPRLMTKKMMKPYLMMKKVKKMMKTAMSENSRGPYRWCRGYEVRIYPGTFNAKTPINSEQ
jgi:hypothetical protein